MTNLKREILETIAGCCRLSRYSGKTFEQELRAYIDALPAEERKMPEGASTWLYISLNLGICEAVWCNSSLDKSMWLSGNGFHLSERKKAEDALEDIRAVLKKHL